MSGFLSQKKKMIVCWCRSKAQRHEVVSSRKMKMTGPLLKNERKKERKTWKRLRHSFGQFSTLTLPLEISVICIRPFNSVFSESASSNLTYGTTSWPQSTDFFILLDLISLNFLTKITDKLKSILEYMANQNPKKLSVLVKVSFDFTGKNLFPPYKTRWNS